MKLKQTSLILFAAQEPTSPIREFLALFSMSILASVCQRVLQQRSRSCPVADTTSFKVQIPFLPLKDKTRAARRGNPFLHFATGISVLWRPPPLTLILDQVLHDAVRPERLLKESLLHWSPSGGESRNFPSHGYSLDSTWLYKVVMYPVSWWGGEPNQCYLKLVG